MTPDITDAVAFRVTLSARAKAGDVLSLRVRQSLTHADLILGNSDPMEIAKVIAKRLNIR